MGCFWAAAGGRELLGRGYPAIPRVKGPANPPAPMTLDAAAKKTLLRKIPHGLFICGVAEGEEVNGFTASWVTQGSFEPPLVVIAVRADSTSNGMIQRTGRFSLNVLDQSQKDLAAGFCSILTKPKRWRMLCHTTGGTGIGFN